MKRRYQIEQQRAVNEFRQLAAKQNPNIQMVLPMAEIVGLLQQGVGHLLREAGLALMSLVMEEEGRHLAGERHQQHEERRAHRWGQEDGYCVIDGQKVPIQRTRLRTKDKREQRLGSYELFQRSGPLEQGVWDKMMRGPVDSELRGGGEGVQQRLWDREVGGEREFHRSQRGESEAIDGAPAERAPGVRGADRRDSFQRSPTDGGAGHRL